jgi:nitrogenase-associated protein
VATVIFYEKPGCKTNARQKGLLEKAGHVVVVRDLLAQPWTPETLRTYFGDTAPARWFNAAAPAVKTGAVDPAAMDAEGALEALAADPILIRRPLLDSGGKRSAGFEGALIDSLLNGFAGGGTVEDCSRPHTAALCANQGSPRSGNPALGNSEDTRSL